MIISFNLTVSLVKGKQHNPRLQLKKKLNLHRSYKNLYQMLISGTVSMRINQHQIIADGNKMFPSLYSVILTNTVKRERIQGKKKVLGKQNTMIMKWDSL